ncbi:MAG: UDP binding domain-containing protein, partial [Pseudomonadota bacterium]
TDDLRESPLIALASRLIGKGIEVDIYDPFVKEAFDDETPGAGRGNDGVPDLKDRLVGDLDQMINDAGVVVVGNHNKEAADRLKAAAKERPVIDLTRVSRDMRSGGTYAGICW